jgi:hypothetical protein
MFGTTLAASANSGAATLEELDLAEIVLAAEAIVVARYRSAETLWTEGTLATRYTFDVEDDLLGQGRTDVTVVVPGGVDLKRRIPIALSVPGAPAFVVQERVLLMLDRADRPSAGDFTVVGFNQGEFRIDAGRVRSGARAGTNEVNARAAPVDEELASFRRRVQNIIAGRRAAVHVGSEP